MPVAGQGQARGLVLRKQRFTTWVTLGLLLAVAGAAFVVDLFRAAVDASGAAAVVDMTFAIGMVAAVAIITVALIRAMFGSPHLIVDARGVTVRPFLAGKIFSGWSSIAELLVCYVPYGTGARPMLFIRHHLESTGTHDRVGWLARRTLARADRAAGGRCTRFHLALDLRWLAAAPEDITEVLREAAVSGVMVLERDFT